MTEKTFPLGKGVDGLEETLRRVAKANSWDVRAPLPTTRELGGRYRISNASVCRLLKRLDTEKVIWRRANGRYYLNESRKLYERRMPYACLLRKLENWSRIYQGIMSGFSRAFGRNKAAMLFVHNETLVRHLDTAHPPVHANADEQRESLTEFFRDHDGQFEGILLDDVWRDDVLAEFRGRLANAVIVCRPSSLTELSSVAPDFDSSALIAVGHLFAKGYDEIWIAVPFASEPSIDLMITGVKRAAQQLGRRIELKNIHSVATPKEREQFLASLRNKGRRIGVFCPEDNISFILREKMREVEIDCPGEVGLLSGMGTAIVTEKHISSIKIDYGQIGLLAGQILMQGSKQTVGLPPQLYIGETT